MYSFIDEKWKRGILLDMTIVIELGIVAVLIVLGIFVYMRFKENSDINIRNASLTVEELEHHARRMAIDHAVSTKRGNLHWPMTRLNENYSVILSLYKDLNDDLNQKRTVPSAAEWLLDNFYVIEEQVKGIRRDLTKKNYNQLPVLKNGPFKGHTRVFAIAVEFVSLVDGQIDEITLMKYLDAYQSHSILFDREIRIIPMMLRLALIENVRLVCEKIKATQKEWNIADEIVETWWSEDVMNLEKIIMLFKNTIEDIGEANPSFVEHLFYRLRRSGKSYSNVLQYIDEHLEKYGTTTELIAQKEHNAQAVSTVSMGNGILSLKYVSSLDWIDLFESASYVEKILQTDPDGTYPQMDIGSRGYYLRQIEKLAKIYGVSELHIAREAILLAKKGADEYEQNPDAGNQLKRKAHVGYYLVGEGVKLLEQNQKGKASLYKRLTRWLCSHPSLIYMGSIGTLTAILMAVAINYAMAHLQGYSLIMALFVGLLVLIPASEMAMLIVNNLVSNIKKPSFFPRLELKDGIPESLVTMVVVPTLLSDEGRVVELLENLETHYLSNREDNLYFALIGAFKDSEGPNTFADNHILRRAAAGIKALNDTYAANREDIFYFYHRLSTFNESDNTWTGWERKRGALMEFNQMMLGASDTTFENYSDNVRPQAAIKYIITLDSDTILPLGMAKKMISTMGHPLNMPVIDHEKGIVVDGYGLMQPRISFDIESSNRSVFSRIFTGQEGMDPYASAISDVYQDLFDEGIFTGKGIYDLEVFHEVLKDAVPENVVLSHDLLEGSYVRAALVSDLELVDSYPSRYNSYMTRLHRWIRGDWQLIPWLSSTIINKNREIIKNPLSYISIWKIIDNLRRSLVSPSIILLMLVGVGAFPGSGLFWIGYSTLVLSLPFLLNVIGELTSISHKTSKVKRHISGFFGLRASLYQFLLSIVFLPYESMVVLHAIGITLFRVLVTKRNMLEWVTSDDAEKNQSNTLSSYARSMGPSALAGVCLAGLSVLTHSESTMLSLLLLLVWTVAPAIAFYISISRIESIEKLELEELVELRIATRKTWRYFEEFANEKNNFLAPDNYQEEPYRGIAYRTSPTNIGLGLLATLTARDMGYASLMETFESLSKTIETVEKLDKWNGHLYNWYDTRTLAPLRPRYISTVDSGNFVCYLITLCQGMKEYLKRPLIDPVYIRGMEDGLRIKFEDGDDNPLDFSGFEAMNASQPISPNRWDQALSNLIESAAIPGIKKKAWGYKVERLALSLRREIASFRPWTHEMDKIPRVLLSEELIEQTNQLLMLFEKNASLEELPMISTKIIENAQMLVTTLKNINGGGESSAVDWLNDLKDAAAQSLEFTITFIAQFEELIKRVDCLSAETQFAHLYEKRRQLFSIGYNLEDNRLTNSYYDLLASEARQTSYIAIARGEVPPKHWFMLGRSLTVVDKYKGLVSWSGTMFEYLMPLLLMKSYRNTLLDETYSFVIKCQKKYGKQRDMPWGTSESSFNSLDIHLDYQYKAIGVPWLGLKRGLIEDAVAAPYATFLALMVSPFDAFKNILYLKDEGLEGNYGYFEAADYTPERLSVESKRVIIKSYMAHHQGMSLLALNNYLNDNVLQMRFAADPQVKSAQLLLQEKVPINVVFTKDNKEKILPFKGVINKDKGSYRRATALQEPLPLAHILSNGNYSVMTTDKGTGYSRDRGLAVTRWREDSIFDNYGMFFYVKNKEVGQLWSTAYAPLNVMPEDYEVVFTADKTMFKRTDGLIETTTEIIVASGDNAEIRRIKLKNDGETAATLEITSFYELVIASHNSDLAHPAFSNLFVETEFHSDYKALIANRRPRSEGEKGLWIAHMPVIEGDQTADIQYETDRMQFIGRGHTVSSPLALERDKPLSNTVGTVLDPALSIRIQVRVEPNKIASISFVTMTADTKDELLELLEKYSNHETCDAAFWLAVVRCQVESKYLNIKARDMEMYQNMISNILFNSPLRRKEGTLISNNKRGQSALWAYGISGDRPIVLVILNKTDEVEILYDVLKAHEYWRLKDLKVDLIILIQQENSYTNPLLSMVKDIVYTSHSNEGLNPHGDVFILNANNMPLEDVDLLYAIARLVLNGSGEKIEKQLAAMPIVELPAYLETIEPENGGGQDQGMGQVYFEGNNLHYFNGLGGFAPDGSTYVIQLENNQMTPAPWSNIIANPEFGFMVTESGGGFTWCGNSRENKLTPWSNDPVSDSAGEIFYIRDESAKLWTLTPLPIREETPYVIRHGFGFSEFQHGSHGLSQKLIQFVPLEGSVKISVVSLKNEGNKDRNLTLTYYATPVMGVSSADTGMHLISSQLENGTLIVENPYNQDFSNQLMFMDTSYSERSVTGDRKEFFGSGRAESPEALKRTHLSGTVGAGYDPGIAMQVKVCIRPGDTAELVFVLGMAKNKEEVYETVNRYKSPQLAWSVLSEVTGFWQQKLRVIQVATPEASMNIMLNGWLLYQVIACRLWARSAFYQSGGAFGFRDQLQDTLSIAAIWPQIAKEQILKHAKHQFVEGDVLHWWHEPAGKGTRTRISDDYLWLPYVTAEYIKITGDEAILTVELPFAEDEVLKDFEDERYCAPRVSESEATLYQHCIRSLDHALTFGERGLPLIGGGDWNDGMNRVGNERKGESVWLAWFLYTTLQRFIPICKVNADVTRASEYQQICVDLLSSIEENAWDGNWYKRAFFDSGEALGSAQNTECKIDSLAQTWAIISKGGDHERALRAMDSLEDYLVLREEGLIKLLTPPFNDGDMEPGYIKGYVPGVRENGGQYTHAAAWVIEAFAMLGNGDKALELFELINPINHARTNRELSIYKVEPYVMAADVYGATPHIGRGGWTWYTGSAGWMYKVGVENILGLNKEGNVLKIEPCIPQKWTAYSMVYKFIDTTYEIYVNNPESLSSGVSKTMLDGVTQTENAIAMINDGRIHRVEILMGKQ